MRFKMLFVAFAAMAFSVQASAIDLNLKNVTVKEAVDALHNLENYSIAVNADEVDLNKVISVNVTGGSVQNVLDQIFAGQNVSYTVNGKRITVAQKPEVRTVASANRTFTGTVVDSQGEPLIGASLFDEVSKKGFITDVNGAFSLEGMSFPATMVVSFLGYYDTKVTLTGSEPNPYTIVLSDSNSVLDEVVVVGYGVQKKVNLTGAVGVVSGKDLEQRPVNNAAQALQGADPSLLVSFGSGSIEGKDYNLQIRGQMSINSGSPLVLIDGIEGSLVQVNPNDVESISVLKDASACAIYGAKASAGVVLISTKNGSEGKVTVNYSGRYSLTTNTTSTNFMTCGYDYVMFTNEFKTYGWNTPSWSYTDDEIKMLYERRNDVTENPDRPWVIPDPTGKHTWVYLANFDWYGYFFNRHRPEQEHNFSISGGNKKMNYYVSGRYLDKDGILNNAAADNYNSYSFLGKVNAEVTPWLHYSGSINLDSSDYNYGGYCEVDGSQGTFGLGNGIMYALMDNIGPCLTPTNPDGTFNGYPGYAGGSAGCTLGNGKIGVWVEGRNHNDRKNYYWNLNNRLTFDILPSKELKLNLEYAYRRHTMYGSYRCYPIYNAYDNNNNEMCNEGYGVGSFVCGSVFDYLNEERNFDNKHSANAWLSYNHSFGDHSIAATLGVNFEDYYENNFYIVQNDIVNENLSYFTMAGGVVSELEQNNTAFRTLGYFGRVNYDYKGKYLFEASGRFDGSSRFPAGSRWGFFPSASAGWRISEEPFWLGIKDWWNNAKVRVSVGSLGNQQISNYYYWDLISTNDAFSYTLSYNDRSLSYTTVSAPVASDLTWETVTTYNLGFDTGFFKDKLTFNADFYIRNTKDMLANTLTLPDVYGATNPKSNAADLRTTGFELSLSWRDTKVLAGKPFSYGITGSLGNSKSVITKFNNPDKLISDYYEGMVLGELWGYTCSGLFASDEEAAAYEEKVDARAVQYQVYDSYAPWNHLLAGDVRFDDINGDGKINAGDGTVENPGDKKIIGNSLPHYLYSFRGDINWAGFDLSIFLQGVGQCDWQPNSECGWFWNEYYFERENLIEKGFPAMCWSEDNPNAYFPRRRARLSYKGDPLGEINTRYLQNAAYLRLKNLTLGYTLPLKTDIIKKCRFYVSGENLAYWSPLKEHCLTVDPEITMTNAAYENMYFYPKTFSVGVDITF